jgi:hypothetical protein
MQLTLWADKQDNCLSNLKCGQLNNVPLIYTSKNPYLSEKKALNGNDWALWRAKINEMIIMDLIRDLSMIQIEPRSASLLYNLNGVKKYPSPVLKPDLFMLCGLPRVNLMTTTQQHPEKNFLLSSRSTHDMTETINDVLSHTDHTDLSSSEFEQKYQSVSDASQPSRITYNNKRAENCEEKVTGTEYQKRFEEKPNTSALKNTSFSTEAIQKLKNRQNMLRNEVKSESEHSPVHNTTCSSPQKDTQILSGVNVKEKVKAFESSNNSTCSDLPKANVAKFSKNTTANKLSKDSYSRLKSESSFRSYPSNNPPGAKRNSLKDIKKKFTRTNLRGEIFSKRENLLIIKR